MAYSTLKIVQNVENQSNFALVRGTGEEFVHLCGNSKLLDLTEKGLQFETFLAMKFTTQMLYYY